MKLPKPSATNEVGISPYTGLTDIVVSVHGCIATVAFYLIARDPYFDTDTPFIFLRASPIALPLTPLHTAQVVRELVNEVVLLMEQYAANGIPAAVKVLTNETPEA